MKLGDLAKVYRGRAIVTACAFYKETKEYYSFMTVGDFPNLNYIPERYENEISVIRVDPTGFLWIDVIEWI